MAMPTALPFFFRITAVRYQEKDPETAPYCPPPNFLFWPSDEGILSSPQSSGWWKWDPGQGNYPSPFLQPHSHEDPPNFKPYKRCTLMWIPERQSYSVKLIDFTALEELPEPSWQPLHFGHVENRREIALVGPLRGEKWLQLPGPNRWFEGGLLSDAYQCQEIQPGECKLAGDLSILLGLVAFSHCPGAELSAIQQSFRPDLHSTAFVPPEHQFQHQS